MVTCYNCGKQVSDETLICPECGALVRRYEAAPRREPEPRYDAGAWQGQRQNGWQNPGWQQNNTPPVGNIPPYDARYAQMAGNGKFRYSTGFSVWLWLCVAGFVLFLCSFIITGVTITGNTPQSQEMIELFRQMGLDLNSVEGGVEMIASFLYWNAGALGVEIILEMILYFGRSRRALLVNLIGSIVLSVLVIFLLGLNVSCIMILAAAVVNKALLRRQIPYMRR